MHTADYRFSLDWDDDGYANTLAAIPPEHVYDYLVAWGSALGPTSESAGVLTHGLGRLTLFDASGLYFRPLTGGLSTFQLRLPHAWKLEIDGTTVREGRCRPVLADPIGSDVVPTTWILEGPHTAQMREAEGWEAESSVDDLTKLLASVQTASGIPVTTDVSVPLTDSTDDLEWTGSWAGLFNAVANMTGSWPIEIGSGSIEIIAPAELSDDSPDFTLDKSYGIDADRSGVGLQTALIRTRMELPNTSGTGTTTIRMGDEERYGRRYLRLPARWFANSLAGAFAAGNALLHRAHPWEFVRVHVLDHQDTAAKATDLATKLVPGKLVQADLPAPGGTKRVTFLVTGVQLTGRFDSLPERVATGLSAEAICSKLGTPTFVVAETKKSVTVTIPTVPDNTTRYWRYWKADSPASRTSGTYTASAYTNDVTLSGLSEDTDYVFQVSTTVGFTGVCALEFKFATRLAPVPEEPLQPFGVGESIRGITIFGTNANPLPAKTPRVDSREFSVGEAIRGIGAIP